MVSTRIILTIPEKLFEKLNKERINFSYSTNQEVILDILRDKFFKQLYTKGKSKSGRPEEGINLYKVGSAKKIFK